MNRNGQKRAATTFAFGDDDNSSDMIVAAALSGHGLAWVPSTLSLRWVG